MSSAVPSSGASVRVVMLGATGAVGTEVVRTLAGMPAIGAVKLLGRRPFTAVSDDRITSHTVDISESAEWHPYIAGATAAICTLGVGQPSAVSREEFVRVDYDIPLRFAAQAKVAGVRHFTLLGSMGANARSWNHYLRTKGELEEALQALRFERLTLVRPSMILTPQNRYGVSQAVTLAVWPCLNPLLLGPLRSFRGIRVDQLGRAIARNLIRVGSGLEVLMWDELAALQ